MRSTARVILVLASIAISTTSCQRERAPATSAGDAGAVASSARQSVMAAPTAPKTPPSMPAPPPAPPPPLPEGTDVTYHCEDGNELTVTYTYATADLRWPDGRVVMLSRATNAGQAGGDAYSGPKVSLRHDGNTIQLRDGGTAAVTCSETEATA